MQNRLEILARLQNDILSLQGFKPASAGHATDVGLGHIAHSFPNATFPISALHEFTCYNREEAAASGAFITSILSSLLTKSGVVLWIGIQRVVFPPALKAFGVDADQIIFVELKKEKEIVWAVEEALRCNAVTCVIAEIAELGFTESRRFQLAIEQSGVACFVLRYKPRNLATASTTRWQVKPLSSVSDDGLPGVVHPRWQVDLLKVRNGKPGSWVVQWSRGRFRYPSKLAVIPSDLQKKTG